MKITKEWMMARFMANVFNTELWNEIADRLENDIIVEDHIFDKDCFDNKKGNDD